MPNPASVLGTLKRPNLLVRAAQIGVPDYKRARRAAKKASQGTDPAGDLSWAHFKDLLSQEAAMDSDRIEGTADYSASKHIEVLTALIVEAEILEI